MKINPSAAAILTPILEAIVLTNAADTDGSDVPSAIACGPCRALFEALRLVLDAYGFNGAEVVEELCSTGDYTVEGIEWVLSNEEKSLVQYEQNAVESASFYSRPESFFAHHADSHNKGAADAKAKLESFRASLTLISNGVRQDLTPVKR